MKQYNHKSIESKWQEEWEKSGIYNAIDNSDKPKWYSLIEFPYPSGDGLHTGHIRSNTAMDIISRKRRMEGFNVLYPIGWDAFGLPTENYAIKTGIHPIDVTKQNTDTFRRQLKACGFSFDWNREVNTSDPAYYKWTQWIFLQLFKKGLAYKTKTLISWCPSCKIGLANEEVVDGNCERCGTPVEKKEKEQWMLAITKYADRLYDDLDQVDFLEKIKIQQRNWIGPSEGSVITFALSQINADKTQINADESLKVEVFTTRADTLFGVTYMVLAPENELVKKLIDKVENRAEVEEYIKKAINKVETERVAEDREKTGVALKGIMAINPANGEEVPVWIADYVLASYGTGAVMAVPAHDERDWAFATKYNLPIKEVIQPLVTKESGEDAFRYDLPVNERKAVVAVIKHWSEDKYLGVEWKKTGWKGFVIGGFEEGEDAERAGLREIVEETGYKNVEFVKALGGVIHARFYQRVKDQNRLAHFEPALFKLKDGEMIETTEEEKALHGFKWLTPEEFESFITHADMQIVWQRLKGNNIYTDDNKVSVGCSNKGILINSGQFDGLFSEEARTKITEFVGGKMVTKYKLRDWIFSRQHYWGEPIPLVFCENCKKQAETTNSQNPIFNGETSNPGWIAVPEEQLPVELPRVEKYQPTDTGESPLAAMTDWVNTKCPKCGGNAKRETDTMPNWAGSSWYFLRHVDPRNNEKLADFNKLKYWMPVDWYNGGMEHTTLHLLYSRFWHKFLFDLGVVPQAEPYQKRTSHGMILGEGGIKMSKSKGNVVNPDKVIELYGADTLRLYEMFMGPFDQAIAWSTESIIGSRRFLEKVWRLHSRVVTDNADDLDLILNQTIEKVSADIERMNFNTAISAMMVLVNEMEKAEKISKSAFERFLLILSPFAPHITEELWQELSNEGSIHLQTWPKADKNKLTASVAKLVVQINGKVRDSFEAPTGSPEEVVVKMAMEREAVKKWLNDKPIRKTIYVTDKLVSFVV